MINIVGKSNLITAPTAVHEWTVTVMIKLLLAFIVGANFGALVIALVKGGDG